MRNACGFAMCAMSAMFMCASDAGKKEKSEW